MTQNTLSSRLMRLLPLLAILFSFAAPALVTTEAMAVVKTKFNATRAQVSAACKKAGGIETGGTGADATSGYGCINSNCDGKGGSCTVDCKDGQGCEGITPGRILGEITTLPQLLGEGVKFEDKLPTQPATPQSLVDSGPDSGPATPTKKPIRQPPIL